jgi:hypothetical protein
MSNNGRLNDELKGLFIFYFSPCSNIPYPPHHLSKLCRNIGLWEHEHTQNLMYRQAAETTNGVLL